jgi:aspartyl-tRNA(Asn)/glutamyl-tRNA(Gln) amidotransferase subunit B
LGLPGALPAFNAAAADLAVKAALALDCQIRRTSRFARKNYFYPDLPKGYQISQFDEPFSDHGYLDIDVGGVRKRARILRIHMEEDAGKSVHTSGSNSIVDLNRAGVPLIEIVGEPDLRSPEEAVLYLRALHEILMFIGINDGNLEQGSFRCDANISLRRTGDEKLGKRVELKNINSFKFVEKALTSEIARQAQVLDDGGVIAEETRGWDEASGRTYSLRSKETAADYRYFPDPDLPPLELSHAFVENLRGALAELPRAKRARFEHEFNLSHYAAEVLTQHPKIADLFERAAATSDRPGHALRVANFIQSEVLRDVTTAGLTASIPITARQVTDVQDLVDEGTISGKQAKELYVALKASAHDASARNLVRELGMAQIVDPNAIESACAKAIADHPKQAEQCRTGKTALFGFFVGQVMKVTKGSANPQIVNETLKRLLGVA